MPESIIGVNPVNVSSAQPMDLSGLGRAGRLTWANFAFMGSTNSGTDPGTGLKIEFAQSAERQMRAKLS